MGKHTRLSEWLKEWIGLSTKDRKFLKKFSDKSDPLAREEDSLLKAQILKNEKLLAACERDDA